MPGEPKVSAGEEAELKLAPEQLGRAGLDGGEPLQLLVSAGRAVASAGDRPYLAGSFDALSPGEVLSLLYSGIRTGLLISRTPWSVIELHFRDGEIAAGSTTDLRLRLGPVLVSHGVIEAETLAELEPLVGPGRKLGKLLTERGVLDAAELYRAIVLQVEEIALELLSWESGTFLFAEGPLPAHSTLRLSKRTRQLCVESARRKLGAPQRLSPSPAETPPKPRHGPLETYRRAFAHIHGTLRDQTGVAQEGLNSYFLEPPAAYRAIFEGVSFTPEGDLPVERILAQAEKAQPGPMGRARALEALESLLAFALFEARNVLLPDAAERLLREVGKLQMRGEL
ncbi:MAG TPA: DUF4388 domain-containing protein [Myxococcales bacterium]|nr:DUF4388 domain-containing protein [Myxococcales bacterium]